MQAGRFANATPPPIVFNTVNIQPEPISLEPFPLASEPREPSLLTPAAILEDLIAEADRRHLAKTEGRPFGPVPPFPLLTREYGGSLPSGLHIVMGGPGIGKTALALQIAAECQCPALYITCEMRPAELLRRMAARTSGTFLGKFKDGSLSGAKVRELALEAARLSPDLAFADGTLAYVSPAWILDRVPIVKKQSPHLLIVVDSLHSWAESAPGETDEYNLISATCRTLREIAMRLDCPILAISERNRASFSKNASKDKLQAGAGSRKLEYLAESALSLERDEDAMESPQNETPVTVTLAKNRNGAQGQQIKLLFNGALQKYREA